MTPEEFRDGLFNLHTRRFGLIAELMIKRLCKLSNSESLFHDLFDDMYNQRVEVKFSTVRKKQRKLEEGSLLQCIADEASSNRMVSFSDWRNAEFDCNIQQVKKNEFDVLYYGCFFSDTIMIFKIESQNIDQDISYSNKQHKGNTGEGQFHINNRTLDTHLRKYFFTKLTYDECLRLLV